MFELKSGDAMMVILGVVYALYCAWAKYCEHRWPAPSEDAEVTLPTAKSKEQQ